MDRDEEYEEFREPLTQATGRIRRKYHRTAKGWQFEDSIEVTYPILNETSDEDALRRHNEIVEQSGILGAAEVERRNRRDNERAGRTD